MKYLWPAFLPSNSKQISRMKRIVGVVALVVLLNRANAQDTESPLNGFKERFSMGLESGYTRNSLITNISSLTSTKYQSTGGFTVGVPLAFVVHKWIALYSNPGLIQKNYEYLRTDFYAGTYEKFR